MYRFGARSQKLPINFIATAPLVKQLVNLDDGSVVERYESSAKPLPPADTLKIKNVLDAGIPIEEVNSKVLQPDFGSFLGAAEFEQSEDVA